MDRVDQLGALHRADNAGPQTIGAAQAKAFTSTSAKNNTLAVMEAAQKNPAAANLVHIPASCCWAAACRWEWATRSSVPTAWLARRATGHRDVQCALAAIDKAKDLLK